MAEGETVVCSDGARGLSELPWKKLMGETEKSCLVWHGRHRVSSVAIFVTTTHALWQKSQQKRPGTAPESFYTNKFCGTVLRLPVPRLPPGGGLSIPKILGTGATLHLGPIHLHDQNWECHAFKLSAQCQKFGVPCCFFTVCKWG